MSQSESYRLAVDEKRAATLIQVSRDTLRRYRQQGIGPRFVRIGDPTAGLLRYRVADIDSWLAANSYASRAEEVSRG